jgi:AbrB family looped-hinge helix DNA binding protein
MAAIATAKLGTKGRMYLPPEVRAFLKVDENDILVFRDEKGKVYIEKLV